MMMIQSVLCGGGRTAVTMRSSFSSLRYGGAMTRSGRRPRIVSLSSSSSLGIITGNHHRGYHHSSINTTSSTTNTTAYPPHTVLPMPALSPTMETGSIASWTIGVGDVYSAGEALCTIETDKASVDYEAQDDGRLARILVPPGVEVTVGTPICVVTENDEAIDVAAFEHYQVETTTAVPVLATPPPATTESPTITTSTNSILFPSARHLAESRGKNATVLVGSGKGGRVTKSDVQVALSQNSLPDLIATTASSPVTTTTTTAVRSPAPAASTSAVTDYAVPDVTGQLKYDDVANSKMRKIIASRLTASKRHVPHCYVTMEVALDAILALRQKLVTEHDIKVSVNDAIIRACALALRDVPAVNNTYHNDEVVVTNPTIDVSVAVATPTGLITPIVFGTDQLGLYQITNTVKDLAARAREGQLQPHEYQGGTFSISNLGMFGIAEFSAVINPPQAAILAVGGGTPAWRPAAVVHWDDTTTTTQPSSLPPMTVQTIMTAQLSADRRVVDEATAAMFLQVFRHYMETPELLLL